ncbi:MAG: SDR family NAD(P)-dependent oxidoreductase [Agarilytica sp.]
MNDFYRTVFDDVYSGRLSKDDALTVIADFQAKETGKKNKTSLAETSDKHDSLLLSPCWREAAADREVATLSDTKKYLIFIGWDEIDIRELKENTTGFNLINIVSEEADKPLKYMDYTCQILSELQLLVAGGVHVFLQLWIRSDRYDEETFRGLSAIIKSTSQEYGSFSGKTIVCSPEEELANICSYIDDELYSLQSDVCYLDGVRKILFLKELERKQGENQRSFWRKEGVYLITGGLGGLGQIFARRIVSTVAGAKVVLTGRSPYSDEVAEILSELKNISTDGSTVGYVSMNLLDETSVANAVVEIEERWGRLNGVIHSAGMVTDGLLLSKKEADFRKVLLPKVQGLDLLDKYTANHSLDFFTMFSSTTGVLGNIGQADYAAANAYMDEFSHYRRGLVKDGARSGNTVSINWPLWQDGGMRVDQAVNERIERLTGIVPLDSQSGADIFEEALAMDLGQVIVLSGNCINREAFGRISGPKILSLDLEEDTHLSKIDAIPTRESKVKTSNLNTVSEMGFGSSKAKVKPSLQSDVAIIGVSGCFPGSPDLDSFWKNLHDGIDCIGEIPGTRWDWRSLFGDPDKEENKTNIKYAGIIEGIESFDPLFFGISPREAEAMDPQQRLLMTYVWKVIEDAGYAPQSLNGSNTGVFIGTGSSGYGALATAMGVPVEGFSAAGMAGSVGPNRMSYFLDLHGPSEPIETACSSSLVAVHRAIRAMQAGDCDQAIVGGINLLVSPELHISFSKAGMLSKDGRCKTFSDGANGYVRGEGVGMLMLKPLRKAEADGDQIYGLIKGSAENHGGRANSLTAPNPRAQAELIKTAFRESGVNPSTVGYVEAHGTGTPLGDPIEVQGLKSAFSELAQEQDVTLKKGYCGLGSVKTNVGHLELAAGVVGIIKVLLQMKHRTLVPSLHCNEINPYIDLAETPFHIVTKKQTWEAIADSNGQTFPRRAGVSSFGFGGVNAHVVLEEYAKEHAPTSALETPAIIVLSAKSRDRLDVQISQLKQYLDQAEDLPDLRDIAYTLQVGRDAMDIRWACVVRSIKELKETLSDVVKGESVTSSAFRGDIKQHLGLSGLFLGDDDLQQALSSWLSKGKYDKLCELWTKGLSWHWSSLYDVIPQRISLPTYPFLEDRYWLCSEDIPISTVRNLSTFQNPTAEMKASKVDTEISEEQCQLLMYSENHVEKALPELDVIEPCDEQLVVFIFSSTAQQEMSELFYSRYSSVHFIQYKEGVSIDDAITECNLNPSVAVTLMYLWPVGSKRFKDDIKPIWEILQYINAHKFSSASLRLCGTADTEINQALMESWVSFDSSLKLVIDGLNVCVLIEEVKEDISDRPVDYVWWAKQLLAECAYGNGESTVYRDGSRYTLELSRIDLEEDVSRSDKQKCEPVIKSNGTYLITGGLGGIAGVFAEYLLTQYQANLVLCGRSILDDARQRRLDYLRSLGGQVFYFVADVCSEEEMQPGIQEACEHFGVIDGVFHAAGLPAGVSVFDKGYKQFRSVLDPKIQGALVLDRLLVDQPLDFVCYLSSISAVLGDLGSCDYAVANRFLLSYAEQREKRREKGEVQGRSIAIAWPLWQNGGMATGDEKQTALYLTSSGQEILADEEGIASLELLLQQESPITLVVKGLPSRVNNFLGVEDNNSFLKKSKSFISTPKEPDDCPAGSKSPRIEYGDLALSECVMLDLKGIASRLLKIDDSRLGEDENLADFGFDSIGLATYAKALSAHFDTKITPSIFFSYSTLNDLKEYFIEQYEDLLRVQYASMHENTSFPSGANHSPNDSVNVTKNQNQNQDSMTVRSNEPIAVIGMSGRFPGARNTNELWGIFSEARSAVGEIPRERFNWRDHYGDPKKHENKTLCKWLGALPGIDEFDPKFFEISPAEAEVMDPRQRLLLQEAWRALEDAGYGPQQLADQKVGMFVGVEQGEYQQLIDKAPFTANHDGILAARLAYILNLSGPALAINTACSSGLVAAHEACVSLRAGDCDSAIAGGVHVLIKPDSLIAMGQAGMLSTEGRCNTFSEKANGMVPGEAVVAVVLKRLSDAERDGDPIHGVIRGSGINYDGKTNGITAPSGKAQSALIREVYGKYKIPFDRIDYIIAHGTGTRLGDPIEVNALYDAFINSGSVFNKKCALTSNKPNLGHTFAASGLVNLVGMLLSMRHEKIPPSIHCEKESDYISWSDSPFFINKNLSPWPKLGKPRLGALSAYGICGTNAHVVVESYDSNEPDMNVSSEQQPHLIALSAKSEPVLRQKLIDLRGFLDNSSDNFDLGSLSFTLLTGRHHFAYRVALVVDDARDAVRKIGCFLKDVSQEGVCSGKVERRFKSDPSRLKEGENTIAQYRSVVMSGTREEMRASFVFLSDLYARGYQLHWSELFEGSKVKRLHLPTYPFPREHYWVDLGSDAGMLGSCQPLSKTRLSPLVHKNISGANDYHFVSSFSGEEFFFNDHLVNNQKVLPGVAYLEMARVAVSIALNRTSEFTPLRIENVVILKPFVFTSSLSEMHIGLSKNGINKFSFEIYSSGVDGGKEMFTQGVVIADSICPPSDFIGVDEPIDISTKEVFGGQCYDLFSSMGIRHGEAFQSIKRIKKVAQNDKESCLWVDVQLPASVSDSHEEFGIHPSIMDGALQSGLGFVLINNNSNNSNELGALIPFAIDSVTVYAPVRASVRVVARTFSNTNKNIMKCDFDIVSGSGKLCARIKGYTSRRLASKITSSGHMSKEGGVEVIDSKVTDSVHLSESAEVGFLTKQWNDMPSRSSTVGAGLNCAHVFLCDLDVSIDVLSSILTGTSVHALRAETKGVSGRYTDIASNLLSEIKSLISKSSSGPMLIQLVIEDGNPFHYEGLAGMLKCVEVEYPRIKTQVIISDETRQAEKMSRYILAEQTVESVLTKAHAQEVRYLGGKRSVMSLSELHVSSESVNPSFWKNDGVYLITGGLGGLGKIFAKEMLCSDKAVHIVLVGRSDLDARRTVDFEELKSLCRGSATVDYHAVDIDDEQALGKLVTGIKSSFGNITGILHSAGLIKDNFVKAKSELELRAVFSPKVSALEKLDEATKQEPLELFVLFSSLSSVFGNVGQSDYAAANGFMDRFAFHRNTLVNKGVRAGNTLSINWPLWESGGMQIEASELEQLMRTTGIVPLPTEQGVRALGVALTSLCSQVAVFSGSKSVKKPLSTSIGEDVDHKARSEAPEQHGDMESDLLSMVQEGVISLISDQLKVKKHDIDIHAEFSEFGFDSVSLTTFGNTLSDHYRIELSPTLFFEYPCVEDFCQYLVDEQSEAMSSVFELVASDPVARDVYPEEKNSEGEAWDTASLIDALQMVIVEKISEQLKIGRQDIDVIAEFGEFGFDSVSLASLGNSLNLECNLEMSPTLFFEYPTIEQLSEYLVAEEYDNLLNAFGNRNSAENTNASNEEFLSEPVYSTQNTIHEVDISDADLLNQIQSVLIVTVCKQLKAKEEDVDPQAEFSEFGFDSVSLTTFGNTLNQTYGLELMPTVFFESPTIALLSEYILDSSREQIKAHLGARMEGETESAQQHAHTASFQREAAVDRREKVEEIVGHSKGDRAPEFSSNDQSNSERSSIGEDSSSAMGLQHTHESIAIVGVSGCFPESPDLNSFWDNLSAGRDCITEVPSDRWDWDTLFGDPKTEENKTNIKHAGIMAGLSEFDPLFFGISPREAEIMDPQQRLIMTYVWKAIEDSGHSPESLSGSNTGVFIGTSGSGYGAMLSGAGIPLEGFSVAAMSGSVGPNRMSFLLNLSGPSEPIETACSSSLVAIHRAVHAINSGQCDQAIVGGVNTLVSPELQVSFSKAGMLSPDGRCKTFSKNANGYVRGEGVGMLVLKRLSEAEADRDNIYAVIRGSAENHGGRANSLTAPNPKAQAALISSVMRASKIDPKTVSYIEAHGTGTPLGDPIEIQGLKKAFTDATAEMDGGILPEGYCRVGSVKSNIGHLELAAGVAGVIKVLLQLKHKKLVPSLHCEEVNPYVDLTNSPFKLCDKEEPWERLRDVNGAPIPLRAGVSSFGFGGVNAHILLEEYISNEVAADTVAPYIFVLSAKTKNALESQAKQLCEYIDENETVDLSRLAYTLQVGRDGMNFRFACIANSVSSLKKILLDFLGDNNSSPHVFVNELSSRKELALLFGGDEDFSETVSAWVNKRKLDKLASLWVKGVPLDWTRLYSILPKRMSFPSYPFEKGHYWKLPRVSGPAGLGLSNTSEANEYGMTGSLIGPVIHKNISDISGLKFLSVFTGKEFFLADHVVMGEKILPAVVYLEMANIAIRNATDSDEALSTIIENIVFLEPLVVGNKDICVHTSISLVASTKVNFEISSVTLCSEAPPNRRVHAQGTLTIEALDNSDSFDSQGAFDRTDAIPLDVDRYYGQLSESGLEYGVAHRAITKMSAINGDVREAVGKLALPSSVMGASSAYTLHPSLMDAALQVAGAIEAGDNTEAALKLPFAIEKIKIYRTVNTSVDVVARPVGVISNEVRKYDIDIYLENGELAVSLAGFSTRILRQEKTPKTIPASVTLKPEKVNDEARLSDTILGEHQAELNDILRRSISDHLNIDFALVDVDSELSEFGFDSVTLTGFGNILNQEYGFELTPTTFFEFPTVTLLSDHLLNEYPDHVRKFLTIPASKTNAPDLDEMKLASHPEADKIFDSDCQSKSGESLDFLSSPFCIDNLTKKSDFSKTMGEAIAIVGVSGAFPEAGDIDQFWENISNGRDCITEMPNERWDWESIYGDPAKDANKTNIKSAGVLKGVDEFDPLFFGISPKEATTIDPQQRILMTYVWKVIEDAGYAPSSLSGTNTGVFIGTGASGYGSLLTQAGVPIEGYSAAGMVGSVGPNRVSFLLNLHGPSEPIETACSSSLVAIHRAVSAMRLGQCDQAIVGGVNLLVTPEAHISFTKAGMLSTDGKCKSFSSSANGYVRGEGVGMLFLKRLSDAEKEGDQIYGVIRGSAENHGGRSNSLTAPNPNAQASVIQSAIEQSGIDHNSITYIEAHGTGTPLGDPVEVQGLKTAFKNIQDTYDAPFCGVGSVKTNIGHLELAAGVAGVIKVLLQMKHKTFAPSLHCDHVNEYINLENSPFYFVKEPSSWDCIQDEKGNILPRRAGVSSFGFGGVNAHVILEEYADSTHHDPEIVTSKRGASVVVLSAKNRTSLLGNVAALYQFLLKNQEECDIESLAYTLQVGRDAMNERVAFVVDTTPSLIDMLKGYMEKGASYAGVFDGSAEKNGEALSMFSGDSELLGAVDKWVSLGKWKSLAELWVKGLKFDWHRIYTGRSMRRMHLPTYEFSRDSYWIGAPSRLDMPAPSNSNDATEKRTGRTEKDSNVSLSARLESRLNDVVCDLTNIPSEKIVATASLDSYGMDSIVISKFNDILAAEFPRISKIFFYENKTLGDISKRLLADYEPQCAAWVDNEKVQPSVGFAGKDSGKYSQQTLIQDHAECISKLRASQRKLWAKCTEEEEVVMREPIAIIGIDGRYPGADNVEEFWSNIKRGVNSITEIPEERWPIDSFYDDDRLECVNRGKSYSKWGGFLKNVANFDPLFFNITPQLARDIDPQERIFLQACWNTIEDAGYNRERLARQHENRVGVFAGVTTNSFSLYGPDLWQRGERSFPISSFGSLANRVSYTFNFNGPSMPVDTMCSASLTAIHEACEHIYRGDCELALAGGVNLFLHPSSYIMLCGQQMLSPDGQCKSFGEGGNGFVPGEGVGAVLLKRLSHAERDGDHIYGVVRGTSVNHGGRTSGFTVPNPNAQTELIKTALSRAEVHPREVSYIEAHGTGTALGDPIEVTGLTNAFREHTQDVNFCKLGSVKTNIGHAESAAGIAGLTKVLMQMKYGELAPSLHSESLNESIEFSSTPFSVQQNNIEWERPVVDFGDGNKVERPRIAGVSSFGAGGVNAHVVIEEYIAPEVKSVANNPVSGQEDDLALPIVLSAKSEGQLREYAQKLYEYVESNDIELESLAYTLQVGREAMEHRLGFVASNISSLSENLRRFIQGEKLEIESSSQKKNKNLNLWVAGEYVDWIAQWPSPQPKTLSLPTYPFLTDKYWIPIAEGDANYSGLSSQEIDIKEQTDCDIRSSSISVNGDIGDDVNKSVLDRVVAVMSNATGIKLSNIDPDDPIENYGIDSIVVNKMNHALDKMFDKYSNTIMYENFSLRSVADQIECINSGRSGDKSGLTLLTPSWEPSSGVNRDIDYESHVIVLLGFEKSKEDLICKYFGEQERSKVVCLYEEYGGFDVRYVSYATQLLNYLQQIIALKSIGLIKVQLVISSDKEYSLFSGLSKLLNAAAIESDRVLAQLLLIQSNLLGAEVLRIIENEIYTDDDEIRYVGSERSRKVLVSMPELQGSEHGSWDDGGVYLISGGNDALGLKFAEYIASKVASPIIVLVGQNEPSERSLRLMENLESNGAWIEYRAVDIGEMDNVTDLVDEIVQQYGELSGVIHAAGIIDDGLISNKTEAALCSALSPKICGVVALDEATRDHNLNFFLSLASFGGAFGSAGKGGYSVANTFLDSYSMYRNELVSLGEREGHTITVEWLSRNSEGMAADLTLNEYPSEVASQLPLEDKEVFSCFEEALPSVLSRVLVLYGDEKIANKDFFLDESRRSKTTDTSNLSAQSLLAAEDA